MVDLDWGALSFSYLKTPYNVRVTYKNGAWGKIEVHTEETIDMHIAATCLHYGQEAFEGLKAFRCQDGKVRIFRIDENGKRMAASAAYLKMAEPPLDLFIEATKKVVKLNEEYVPPFGSGASLYIRPVLLGTGAQVGVKPAAEYTLIIFVTPVGPYFKKSGATMSVVIERKYDRAAPHGTGHIKAGGNYGASMTPAEKGHNAGYDSVLYLDPQHKKYIDECGAANFFAIKGNSYVTPASPSILPSITNMSLCALAEKMGLKVERRKVAIEELSDFSEAGACGTAAVITPISTIFDPETGTTYSYGDKPGKYCTELYNQLTAIQLGMAEDVFGWNTVVE